MKPLSLPLFAGAVCAAAVFAFAPRAIACSVPVFRYALERWSPDPAEVVVFHRGGLQGDAKLFCDRIERAAALATNAANIAVRPVDAQDPIPEDLADAWKRCSSNGTPVAAACYPRTAALFWWGPPVPAVADRLADSPARRAVARLILKGASAVWVLMETGDAARDASARALLETTLARLEKELTLPEIDPEDAGRYLSEGGPALKVWFPIVRVAWRDPAEDMFARMLSECSEGISAADAAAFAFFGRGRLLGAWQGAKLTQAQIEDACAFLVGMCSCQVKEENPGTDIIFSVGWDSGVTGTLAVDEKLPDLVATPAVGSTGAAPPRAAAAVGAAAAKPACRAGWTCGGSPVFVSAALFLVALAGIVAVLSRSMARRGPR